MSVLRRLWPDSLFTRMLLLQGALVAAAALIFTVILAFERAVLLVPSHTALAVPVIRQVAVLPVGTAAMPSMGLSEGVRREAGPPAGLSIRPFLRPIRTLKAELLRNGIQMDQVLLTAMGSRATLWTELRIDGGAPVWVSFNGYYLLPNWGPNPLIGLLLLTVLVAVVSRSFVRRVTHPLARLHDRMLSHAQAGVLQPPPTKDARWQPPPELQAMDQAYTQLADKLARNERERALLLAGVSHDLRSPLARIRLAAEMLPETPDNAYGVAAVTRNVDQADRLIASFLEFVRAGTQKLDETFDAVSVVGQAVVAFNRPSSQLTVQLPERLLLHNASSLLLERLVVNLVDNALKHGSMPVQVRLACVDDAMQLTVTDSGPGLPPGGADRLMEAFARGDASRGVPGFGLGLAIVHQIVTRFQAQLQFVHSPDQGHSVQVTVPLNR